MNSLSAAGYQHLADELCRRRLQDFFSYSFGVSHGGETPKLAPYIGAICHQLERVLRGEIKRLIITMPPRHGKSEIASMAFPAWCLGHDPQLKFMIVSYGLDLASAQVEGVRQLVGDPRYARLFPSTRVRPGKDRRNIFSTIAGGTVRAVSTGGAVTGFGTDIMIIDDLHKADEALTPVGREAALKFYQNSLLSRFNDPAEGRIIVIQQRLHEEDIVGWLLDQAGWEHLNLPAIAEQDEIIAIGHGQTWQRRKGDLLHPDRFPLHILEERRLAQGNRVFGAQYQQNPIVADGSLIRLGWFGQYDERPERSFFHRIVQSWDTAAVATATADFSVGMTWGYRDGEWYLLDLIRARMEFPDLKARAIAWHRQWKADAVVIEGASSGFSLWQEFKHARVPGEVLCPRVSSNKVDRTAGRSAQLAEGEFLLPASAPWLTALQHELVAFPDGRHDDQVDALVQFLEFIFARDRWTNSRVGESGRLIRPARPPRPVRRYT